MGKERERKMDSCPNRNFDKIFDLKMGERVKSLVKISFLGQLSNSNTHG